MDFYKIKERVGKNKVVEIYPDFQVGPSKDLMVRGKSFYAIWDEAVGLWSTNELDVPRLVDQELYAYRDRRGLEGPAVVVKTLTDFSSGSWSAFMDYVKKAPDNSVTLDDKLTFADTVVKRTDYVSKRLPYSLKKGPCPAWTELSTTLYDPKQLEKIEWSIGAVLSGDSRNIQKFLVFYGEAGAGKSTILNVVQKLFEGYFVPFDARALTSSNNAFALEMFRNNPLVAIQHDGDLSRIEDNTKLNSVVSHELMSVNEKYKAPYKARMNCFLFMATNRPVKITDAKSGVIRRLIDVNPSGRRLEPKRYSVLMGQIGFELGEIAQHCLDVYWSLGKNYYNTYNPYEMILQTDVFFNFMEDSFNKFEDLPGISLKNAYAIYKNYCDESTVEFKLPMYKFREELKNYFENFDNIARVDGKQVRSYYSGFIKQKFLMTNELGRIDEDPLPLVLDSKKSLLDDMLSECKAQYAKPDETPEMVWRNVTTTLSDLDTKRLHYVKVPSNHIVIDFDLKDEEGNKSAQRNLEEASKWPPTYAEYSKGGAGIHLHYIYDGDTSKLKSVYSEGIEVKVFRGNSSLRRKLTMCNSIPVRTLTGGLPLKEEKVVNLNTVKSEEGLRKLIRRNLAKEIHPGTKPSIDFIKKILDDAYDSGMRYDVSNMRGKVLIFASKSTHHAEECVKLVSKMKFKSKDEADPPPGPNADYSDGRLAFFDVEVFPNLFLVNWKFEGEGTTVVRMINPSPADIEDLMKLKLIGFNCRRYDNHILYARYIGYTNEQLYKLSQSIISGGSGMFRESYDISYTDVYDFSSKKQSLKKFEIELGIHHQELGLPWDQPVPEELWSKVAEYCDNDVIATEAVFKARQADWTARKVLAALAGMTVNDTTNSLTTKIIFGGDKKPQAQFNYRKMGELPDGAYRLIDIPDVDPNYTVFDSMGRPIFPGYTYDAGVSTYRDEEVGEGGYVYAEPGVYRNVALLDIASMHPSSIVAENLFGDLYTGRFNDLLQARIHIKHREFDIARTMLDGKLAPFLDDESAASDLAQALKIAINSVYGLTSAKFDNPFRDIRNIDNIVAKRGALFMVNLKHEVQNRGFTVAHIKTDSIKIPDATPDIIQFVMDYGKAYGYNFEHEATYDRMCLVNDAVYIARYRGGKHDGEWTATGKEFQRPYIFKKLFSHEPIVFSDLCETFTVNSALYLDMNEGLEEGEHDYRFIGKAGCFAPVRKGKGGGLLMREKDGKYYAAAGTKGYRWLEAEYLEAAERTNDVDESYYILQADEAKDHIGEYVDFELFAGEEMWTPPCGDFKRNNCAECPNQKGGKCSAGYAID